MRIISGRLKGRRLASFSASHIRPTTDRVKESLFNILQGHWEGAVVLDLFSGTGNLSFECVSRGAAEVIAVEDNRKSQEIILKNQKLLGVESGFRLVRDDVFKFLKKYKGAAFDVVLVDPPFTEAIAHDAMVALSESGVKKPGTVFAIESSAHERMDDKYDSLSRFDSRNFGDKLLSLFVENSKDETTKL